MSHRVHIALPYSRQFIVDPEPTIMKKINNCKKLATAIFGALSLTSSLAHASVSYLGSYGFAGNSSDLSGLTDTLEDGSAHNKLGGFGSAIAYTGYNNIFVATPDRGPADGTTSYINRFQQFQINVVQNASSSTGWSVNANLVSTTLMSNSTALVGSASATNPDKKYFTGLSSGYDSTASSNSMRFDPEGVRVSSSGNSIYVSDEYGPYIYEFNRSTGQRIRAIELPGKFAIANPSANGNLTPLPNELTLNSSGRQANRGMEGLAISPDGTTLFGLMQNPLIQDGAFNGVDANGIPKRAGGDVRLVKVDIATGATQEFVYQLDSGANNGLNEIVAINDHEFLVIERDGKAGSAAAYKKITKIDITGATDVSGIAALPASGLPAGVNAVSKSVFIDLLNPGFGLAGTGFPEKIEGLTFGQDLSDGRHLLLITSDNDLNANNPSMIYAFAVDGINYQAQQIAAVPVPAAAWLFGSALIGLAGARRRARNR